MDKIEITGMKFSACHGCLPEEKTEPQPFVIDTVLFLPLKKAGESDDIADTVDYVKIFALVEKTVTATGFNLIEALADEIAKRILAAFGNIERTIVTVHKPASPLMTKCSDVSCTVERTNGET